MQKFKVQMMREVVSCDSYEIEITANDEEAAYSMAQAKLDEINSNCPDDIKELGYMYTGSWQIEKVVKKDPDETQS